LISEEEITARWKTLEQKPLVHDSPWQELYRAHVGQLETGGTFDFATRYHDLRKIVPRHSH
jgi:dihydroxy-acid dehydratase